MTSVSPGGASRIDGRFAAVAARHPRRVAVSDQHGQLTYREVERLADQVAEAVGRHARAGQLVALLASRNRYVPSAVIGILRSGAAYLPVDPNYPLTRRTYLLDDSGTELVLTDGAWSEDETPLSDAGPFVLTARPSRAAAGRRPITPPDTAYVIYTSGSTGSPKGCVVDHRHVLALLDAAVPLFGTGADDIWTLFHSWSFDFSVWEIWGALLYGGHAVVVDRETAADPQAFARLLADRRVTVLNQVPSVFGSLVDEVISEKTRLPDLRHVVFGGEALVAADVQRWWAAGIAPSARLVNMYGITETTVHVTHCPLTPAMVECVRPDRTPIGRPLPHLTVSLRDEHGHPVPSGEPGELWVGGAGVCHGYLQRPELTQRRFAAAPEGAGRFYRSGDWAVADTDGQLFYLGRSDGQVKLYGFRIELGEIEAELRKIPGVSGAAVQIDRTRCSGPALSAYLVADAKFVSSAEIRAHLAARLPSHMLPQRLHYLGRLPVTVHGKLDRVALARLDA
jgi:amino acid adenylation domain-containing protein